MQVLSGRLTERRPTVVEGCLSDCFQTVGQADASQAAAIAESVFTDFSQS